MVSFDWNVFSASDWHPKLLIVYTLFWVLAIWKPFAGIAYIALSFTQLAISKLSTNAISIANFSDTLFPIDLIFSLILIVDILRIKFPKGNI